MPTTVTVARAEPGLLAHFPDVVALPGGGRLLVTYREGAGHVRSDGRIRLVASEDGGQSWGRPWTAADGPYDDRDPKLAVLADGTLLLTYFVLDWSTDPHTNLGVHVRRSADSGRTWSEPFPVATTLGRPASHGAALQVPGGDVLQPVYGKGPGGRWEQAAVVRSTDGGRTWPAGSQVLLGARDGIHFQEPTLTLVADQVVALIRSTGGVAWLSRSRDSGRTWSAVEATDLPASSHHALATAAGEVLVTYGDLSSRFSTHRETVGRLIRDPLGSWTGRDLPLYDSGHHDQANPSSAEPVPGRFVTVGFDVPHAAVVATSSSVEDYR